MVWWSVTHLFDKGRRPWVDERCGGGGWERGLKVDRDFKLLITGPGCQDRPQDSTRAIPFRYLPTYLLEPLVKPPAQAKPKARSMSNSAHLEQQQPGGIYAAVILTASCFKLEVVAWTQ